MGVLDAFVATWSRARATFGNGIPQDGSAYDQSANLSALQADVQQAGPGQHWTGPGSDVYAAASEKQAGVLGEAARLDRQLRAEVDKSAEVVAAGRRELDSVREWVLSAASGVPPTADGERMLYPVVSRGSGEIVEILERSTADLQAISGRIGGISAEYQALGGDLKVGAGGGAEPPAESEPGDEPQFMVGDENAPWSYPVDPPPPPDSAPGGGRWELGQPYPPGPGGGPSMGPVPVPQTWHRTIDPPVVGGPSGLQDVVRPPPNGWDVTQPAVLKEGYRFRVTGEGFSNGEGHVRWVERDGSWYQAQWIDYDLEAEHVRHLDAKIPWTHGFDEWEPMDIKDIHGLQVDNPRLTVYIPDPAGGVLEMDPGRPTASRSR